MSTNFKVAAIYFIFTVATYVLVMHFAFSFAWQSAIITGLISSAIASIIFVFWFRKKISDKRQ